MLQYLLNSTAIWLISLIVFDLFLRRESYHNYNRFYLLSTFLLGLLLPAIQWPGYEYLQPALQKPVQNIIGAKTAIANTATATTTTISLAMWIGIIYMAGAALALVLIGADIIKLIRYYTAGTKTIQGNWTIVETGREHAPFSFRKLLFVNTIAQYDHQEWDMLFIHEQEHTRRLHIADLLLMQLSRIFLWFHPLVYIYNQRLLLVHEYQADNISTAQPRAYGQFLVEQAVLGAAPHLSHSFNRSPIKKRIIMLTRKSTTAAKTKMLVFAPVVAMSIFCFSQNGYSQKFERNGNMVTYSGNKFEMSKQEMDSVELQDPVTNQKFTRVVMTPPYPLKMNGKTIYDEGTDVNSKAAYVGTEKGIRAFVLPKMRNELARLEDGNYNLNLDQLVIDEKGKIVYFNYHDLRRNLTREQVSKLAPGNPDIDKREFTININGRQVPLTKNSQNEYFMEVDKNLQQIVFQKLCKTLTNITVFKPAIKDGKPVISTLNVDEFWNQFKIENHKVYDKNKDGTWKPL